METRVLFSKKCVLAVLVFTFFAQAPLRLDAGVNTQDNRVRELLGCVEQIFLIPNGGSLQSIDTARSVHLENLAIMLGLVLRVQIGYAQDDQTLTNDFMELQGRTMIFLEETARQSGHLDDPEHFWRGYAVAAIEGKCNEYARRVFKVDPDMAYIPMLLASAGVEDGAFADAGRTDPGADASSSAAAETSVDLLREQAPENTIDPYPRSSPQALEADSIVGIWNDFSDRGAQLEFHKTGEGRYEGRLVSEGTRRMRTAGGWQSFRFFVAFESFNTGSHLNMGSWNDAMFQMEIVYADYERPPSMIDAHNKRMPPVVEKRVRAPVKMSILNGQLFMRIGDGITLSASLPSYQWKK